MSIPHETLREIAHHHPIAWAMYASEGLWKRSRHLIWLADRLMALYTGEIKRLAVSMPPRHGKSELISKYFPTWWLLNRPYDRIVQCSYGERLTVQWSRASRDLFAAYAPTLDLEVPVDAQARASVTDWPVLVGGKRAGGVFAVGKGGGLTGRGADLLICDDLIRDDMEARNATLRDHAWSWFQSVALTRLSPGARAVMIATRWHHDDPIGRIERMNAAGESGEPWTVVNLPAVAEPDDALGREPGEALWPERFPVEALEKIKRDVGPYVWGSLYQGQPTPSEGGLFKREWFTFWTQDGEHLVANGSKTKERALFRFATLDLAFSTKTSADYTVCCIWGADIHSDTLYLLHLERDRVDVSRLADWIRGLFSSWGIKRGFVERSGFYADITRSLVANEGLPLEEIQPNTDKVSRAQPAAAMVANGSMVFKGGAPWWHDLEQELMAFDAGKHDDQVDAVSYGAHVFRERFLNRNVTEYEVVESPHWRGADRFRKGGSWI